jgi:hypothetical protein
LASNPVNLAVRFLLELAALAAMAYWGWLQHDGLLRVVLAIGAPLLAVLLWFTFAVPGDPSRSGKAAVPVPGIVRLVLELAIFGSASYALYDAGNPTLALVLAVVVIVHYALSYDRLAWLVGR